MRRSKKTEVSPDVSNETPLIVVEETVSEIQRVTPDPAPTPAKERLSVPLTDTGAIDWDTMREGTRVKLRELLKREAVSFAATQGDPASSAFVGPAECGYFLSVLGEAEIFFAKKAFGVPEEIARRALSFTQEEADIIAPAMQPVLNKHASVWFINHRDEIGLALILLAVHQRKFSQVAALMKLANKSESVQ